MKLKAIAIASALAVAGTAWAATTRDEPIQPIQPAQVTNPALVELGWAGVQTLAWLVLPLAILAVMLGLLVEFLQDLEDGAEILRRLVVFPFLRFPFP